MIFPKLVATKEQPNREKEFLKQIATTVKQYGECYVHGDGNLFAGESRGDTAERNSKFRQEFSNPKQLDSTYAVRITAANMPNSMERLKRMLEVAKNQEIEKEQQVKPTGGLTFLAADEDPENKALADKAAKEAEFERQVAEQEKADKEAARIDAINKKEADLKEAAEDLKEAHEDLAAKAKALADKEAALSDLEKREAVLKAREDEFNKKAAALNSKPATK